MKAFAGFIVVASATVDRITTENWWQGNPNAPHCGCQIIIDPATYGGYINSTCSISFPYADEANFGRATAGDPHFLSVASSYMVGRDRADGPDNFKFTGFDEVSNPGVLDILVFYEHADCAAKGRSIDEIPSLEQHQIWEVYNVSAAQGQAMCQFELDCTQNNAALPGVYLGNFNYDIARSVQTYTVPIYGLAQGQNVTFDILDYNGDANNCMNAAAHAGHGTVEGCSKSGNETVSGDPECANSITFRQNPEHWGMLEYFQFEPIGPMNSPECFAMPIHHVDDYTWNTPSPWDTQENFQSTNPNLFV